MQKKGQAVWNWLAGLDWPAQVLEGFREVHIRYGLENKGVMGHDPTRLVV